MERLVHCKDWLNYKLTGIIATDYSDASTALLNISKKCYVKDILEAMDIGEKDYVFPKPVASTAIIGYTSENAVAETGLNPDIPVIAGSIDVAAVASGLNVEINGSACTIMGSTMCNEMVMDMERIDLEQNMGICHIPDDSYMSVMPTLNGTTAIDWIKSLLFNNIDFDDIDELIKDVPVGSRNIVFLPYLYGERAPFRNAYATGGFSGLSAIHTGKDMYKAVYEGLVFNMYECYQQLPPIHDGIAISGGGAASDVLCQTIADCLGKPVRRPSDPELGIMGVAKAIGAALDKPLAFEEGNGLGTKVFEPNMSDHIKYMELFASFQMLRYNMEEFWLYMMKKESV